MPKELAEGEKTWAAAAYVLVPLLTLITGGFAGFFGPIIAYAAKKESKYVRFHTIQSFLLSLIPLAMGIIMTVGMLGSAMANVYDPMYEPYDPYYEISSEPDPWSLLFIPFLIVGMVIFILYLYIAYEVYGGNWYRLPILSGLAEKYSKNLLF